MSIADHKPAIILLAEDETLVRMIASDILTDDASYRVIEAANADEALTLLEARHDVRVVFTDVDMPGSLNGYALARIVDMRWPGIALIVTSGLTGPGIGDLPKKARFLPKPYSPATLLDTVRDLLAGSAKPITLPGDDSADGHGAAILPVGIKVDQLHTGLGTVGGLAQPLPEPEE